MEKKTVPLLFIALLILLSCNLSGPRDSCKSFDSIYSQMLKSGIDTQALVRRLDDFITNEPKCIDAFLTRGDIYIELDNLGMAKRDYDYVLRLDMDNVYALYQLGIIASLTNEYDSVIYYLERAMKLKKTNGIIIDFKTDNPSISAYKYDIEATHILYLLGLAYYYKNDIGNAFDKFDYCIKHQYLLSSSYLYRGALYLALKQKENACEDFKRSAELGDSQAVVYQKKYCGK